MAICTASELGRADVVELLLKHGADMNARNGYPLRWAVTYGHVDVVRVLAPVVFLDRTTFDGLVAIAKKWSTSHGKSCGDIISMLEKRLNEVAVAGGLGGNNASLGRA